MSSPSFSSPSAAVSAIHNRIASLRERYGLYPARDWARFAEQLGIDVYYANRQLDAGGYFVAGALLLSPDLPALVEALLAWHELAHAVLHRGNREVWRSFVGGDHVLRRFEREAWAFALCFPLWSDDDLLELPALVAGQGLPWSSSDVLWEALAAVLMTRS